MVFRLAFVGCGNIAQYHVQAYSALPEPLRAITEVTVLVDPSPENRRSVRTLVEQAGLSSSSSCTEGGGLQLQEFSSLTEALAADQSVLASNPEDGLPLITYSY